MKYLVELVFGVGFLGLAAMVLSFVLRFLLLRWAVRLIGRVVMAVLRFVQHMLHAVIYIFGIALLGAFIVGFGLQVGMNLAMGGAGKSADPTMAVLVALLAFFLLVALRGWQWRARHSRQQTAMLVGPVADDAAETPELADCPIGYENVTEAWSRAITLAPRHRNDLLEARATCAALVKVVEAHDGVPDPALIETAALIRNHLAALVDGTERRLHDAKPSTKAAITEEMVKFLLGFARRAKSDLTAVGFSVEDEDEALRAHLASQLFG
jgi:hypothetical protein